MQYHLPLKKVSIFIGYLALIGCLITISQIIIILVQGDPLCLNQGCKIVESQTRIPPLFFNIAGLLFFLSIYGCARSANRGSTLFRRILMFLLLAAISTEAVLVNFQYFIVQAFCTYCLIICGIIILLNILTGAKQTARALLLFCAVTAAFASLDFGHSNNGAPSSYQNGVFATRPGLYETEKELHLFFSSTCSHCENVIQTINDTDQVTISFNPIDTIEKLNIEGIDYLTDYSSQNNQATLATLGIDEIPILLLRDNNTIEIIRGEKAISARIIAIGKSLEIEITPEENNQSSTSDDKTISSQEDGCSVLKDCEEEGQLIPQ